MSAPELFFLQQRIKGNFTLEEEAKVRGEKYVNRLKKLIM